jgi:hypothetical protein
LIIGMADHALDLALWEAIVNGNLHEASRALEQGADPNRRYAVSRDSYGHKAWDFSMGGSLPWKHILINAHENAGVWQPPTRGVPNVAVNASGGDTLLHICVKLMWHELAAILSLLINIDESVQNDDYLTAREVALEMGDDRVKFYRRYFVGCSDFLLIENGEEKEQKSLSPMQHSRSEFRKSAARSLEVGKRLRPTEFADPNAPSVLAGYVEQGLMQLEMSPAGNDETVIPQFPRYLVQQTTLKLRTKIFKFHTL